MIRLTDERENDAIGLHPGDIGMEKIANQLFVTINGAIEQMRSMIVEYSGRK